MKSQVNPGIPQNYGQFHVGLSRHKPTSKGSKPPEDSYTKQDLRFRFSKNFASSEKKYQIIGPFGTEHNKSTILEKSQNVNKRP